MSEKKSHFNIMNIGSNNTFSNVKIAIFENIVLNLIVASTCRRSVQFGCSVT